MAKRSSVEMLPLEVKSWLDKALADGNFSGYTLLETTLKERGFDIGKSSIHRYGQKLESKLRAIKTSTQAALAISEAAPDDADLLGSSIIQMVQSEVFDVLVQLQEADDSSSPETRLKMMAGAAKSIAELSRASINAKKHQISIKEKTKLAADSVAQMAKKGGLTPDAVNMIRQQILGISA